jgi:DeoR family transcriptional regulator of aga operon
MPAPQPALLPEARRSQILAIIEQRGFVRVSQLSRYLGVSDVTVRADLDALASNRAVQRVHGGAISGLRAAALERPFEQSLMSAAQEKVRIGNAAAALVTSNQSVMIDVGTTNTAVARALAAREDVENVVIITNALNIALEFERVIPRFTVIVTGGTLRPAQHSLVDPLADVVIERLKGDIAFVGATGIDVRVGVSNANVPEADMKRRMLQASSRAVVVADSQKLGISQLSRVVPITGVDTLITGAEAPRDEIEGFRKAGVEVILA